jgi:hypothetical protein
MANLFDDLTDLATSLQVDLDAASADEARRKAQAWLASATSLTAWPTPIPEDLRAWAIELAALAYDNPSMLESETLDGGATVRWALNRRTEILDNARARYGSGAIAGRPEGNFPAALDDPDPLIATQPYYVWAPP